MDLRVIATGPAALAVGGDAGQAIAAMRIELGGKPDEGGAAGVPGAGIPTISPDEQLVARGGRFFRVDLI